LKDSLLKKPTTEIALMAELLPPDQIFIRKLKDIVPANLENE